MAPDKLLEESLTRSVIGAFYEVYNHLGFGFLESLYASALERELLAREHAVVREFCVRVLYTDQQLAAQKPDTTVDDHSATRIKAPLQLTTPTAAQLTI